MYKTRNVLLVKYGHFRDYFSVMEKLAQLCEERGWAQMRFWVPAAGRDNEIVTEREYGSFEEYARENEAWHKDAEIMDLVRESSQWVEPGTSFTYMEESAFQIA